MAVKVEAFVVFLVGLIRMCHVIRKNPDFLYIGWDFFSAFFSRGFVSRRVSDCKISLIYAESMGQTSNAKRFGGS